jgi:hypothetical protein
MITTLEEFKVYNEAMELSEKVWTIVTGWKQFEEMIGKMINAYINSIGLKE